MNSLLANFALIRELRNDYGCQVPIVALVAGDDPAARDRCIALGADDVLFKPVEGRSLVELLRRCLARVDDPHKSP